MTPNTGCRYRRLSTAEPGGDFHRPKGSTVVLVARHCEDGQEACPWKS